MPETLYNWNKERELIDRDTRKRVKIPTQSIITEHGLKPTSIPVYHKPVALSIMSRGFMDYDPLGRC